MNETLAKLLKNEEQHQDNSLNLIASENYTSREVSLALTSITANKYAEGYGPKRYYGGCATVNEIEDLAINLAKELFKVDYVNVQPHSGSNANLSSYFSLLNLGDKVLAPAMDSGGHLTHGAAASITSKLFNFTHYHTSSSEGEYNMAEIASLAIQQKPKLIIAGTSAYSKAIDWEGFAQIARSVNAYLLADIAHLAGLIAASVIDSPIPHADIITSTTQKTLRGPRGGMIMTNNKEVAKQINRAVFPGLQGGPHMHTIAAKAQCFAEASEPEFAQYAKQVIANAKILHSTLKAQGCVMWCDTTDTHLLNINTLKSFNIDGKAAEHKLEKIGIIVNREALPGDTKPLTPSGIRLGTAALTTRGMREAQMQKIGQMIFDVLRKGQDISKEVKTLVSLFPL